MTNGYAGPFITSFKGNPDFADTFAANNATLLTSISQISEALCILMIPFFLKRFGIKIVMLMSMFAWVFRFGFFGVGDPAMPGVIFFVLSCIVYGVAFDFFNVSGGIFVDQECAPDIKASAQGLFMMMTNGLGATIGTLAAQAIVNKTVPMIDKATELDTLGVVRNADGAIDWQNIIADKLPQIHEAASNMWAGWQEAWYIFAGFALVVAIAFWFLFPKTPVNKNLEVKH